MPPFDIEVRADEWEAYCQDMEEIQGELFELWVADMERSYA